MSKNGTLFIGVLMFLAAIYTFLTYLNNHDPLYLGIAILSLVVGVLDVVTGIRKMQSERERRR